MKLLTFGGDEGEQIAEADIPEKVADEAQLWRESMLDNLIDLNDELMELALQEEAIPAVLIHKVIREATLLMQIQPVLCGFSAAWCGHPTGVGCRRTLSSFA